MGTVADRSISALSFAHVTPQKRKNGGFTLFPPLAKPVETSSYNPADYGADWRYTAVCIVPEQAGLGCRGRYQCHQTKYYEDRDSQTPIPFHGLSPPTRKKNCVKWI
jgi:hypothetical protein